MQILRAVPVALLWLQAASAAPAAVEPRQVQVLSGAISKVVTALKGIDSALAGLGPDMNSAMPLLNSVKTAQNTLAEAATEIKGARNVGLLEAINIAQPAMELVSTVQKTLGDLTAKKPVFDQLGVSSVVADALKQQKVAANELTETMFSKLPPMAKQLAGSQVESLNKAVDDAIKVFETPGAAAPAAPGGAPALPMPAMPPTLAPAQAPPASPAGPGNAPAAPKPAPAPAPKPPAVLSTPPLMPQPVAA